MTQRVKSWEQLKKQLLELADDAHISRGELAQRAGLHRCTLYRDNEPSLGGVLELCQAAGLTVFITNSPALLSRAANWEI